MNNKQISAKTNRANKRLVMACAGLVVGMAGLSYAAVPLYQVFCQVTGYGGTTQRAEISDDIEVLERKITVRFDANISKDLDWDFKPAQRDVEINLGASTEIKYTAENFSDRPITGMATFNVTPQYAGIYFNKIECFCFTQTTLQPGEKIDMPVVFFIDPDLDKEKIMKNLETITLSYTFFEEESDETPLASLETKTETKTLN